MITVLLIFSQSFLACFSCSFVRPLFNRRPTRLAGQLPHSKPDNPQITFCETPHKNSKVQTLKVVAVTSRRLEPASTRLASTAECSSPLQLGLLQLPFNCRISLCTVCTSLLRPPLVSPLVATSLLRPPLVSPWVRRSYDVVVMAKQVSIHRYHRLLS